MRGYRNPRELLRETHGRFECVIFGRGRGAFGTIKPAMFIRECTGPGLLDWHDTVFRQAPHPRTLRAAWERFKAGLQDGLQ